MPCSLRSHLSNGPSWRRKSTAEWVPEWVPKKIAGTRSDRGDRNCFQVKNFQRAGDGTRTHDVQLGKEAEKQALSGVRANSPLRTGCLLDCARSISCGIRHRTGPATGPGFRPAPTGVGVGSRTQATTQTGADASDRRARPDAWGRLRNATSGRCAFRPHALEQRSFSESALYLSGRRLRPHSSAPRSVALVVPSDR